MIEASFGKPRGSSSPVAAPFANETSETQLSVRQVDPREPRCNDRSASRCFCGSSSSFLFLLPFLGVLLTWRYEVFPFPKPPRRRETREARVGMNYAIESRSRGFLL